MAWWDGVARATEFWVPQEMKNYPKLVYKSEVAVSAARWRHRSWSFQTKSTKKTIPNEAQIASIVILGSFRRGFEKLETLTLKARLCENALEVKASKRSYQTK